MSGSDKTLLEHITAEHKNNMGVWPRNEYKEAVQDLGIGDLGASEAFARLLEDAETLDAIQQRKATELRKRVREIREEADRFDIPEHEVGL